MLQVVAGVGVAEGRVGWERVRVWGGCVTESLLS